MLEPVQQQNRTKQMIRNNKERENIQAEDNAGHSAARVPEQNKRSETTRKRENIQAEDNA